LIVILFHGGVFERAVHAFHLAIGPGMVGFGEPMVDAILMTDAIKNMLKGLDITLPIGELDAVLSQYRFVHHPPPHRPRSEQGRPSTPPLPPDTRGGSWSHQARSPRP
jgi:hypothetical protein